MATTKKLMSSLVLSALLATIFVSGDLVCHESCRCQGSVTSCRGAGLKSIPSIPQGTVTLDLSGNDFINITSLPLLPLLRHLNLSFSKLSHIEAPAFQRLNDLETLDLSFNALKFLHPGLFSGLYGLKHVNLSHNSLQSENDDRQRATNFRKLDIESLDLSSNGLTRLTRDLMGFFSSIKTLQLSKNRFNYLDPSSIHELMVNLKRTKYEISIYIDDNEETLKFEELFFKELQMKTLRMRGSGITDLKFMDEVVALKLDLSENPLYIKTWRVNPHLGRTCEELYLSKVGLQTRDINFLSSFSNLRVLDLSRNELYLLDGQAIIKMPFLHTLDLSQNKDLSELSLDFYQSLSTLERLNLSGCAFERIDPLITSELGSLSVLDLSYNNFQTLSDIYAGIFETVRTINISFNPLHCNCEMLWFVNWTRSEKFLRSNLVLNDFICSTPVKKPIKEMSLLDFKCREPVIFNITRNMTHPEGANDVMFHCRAESDPPPTLTWISPYGSKQSNRPSANRTRYVMFSYMKLSPLRKSEHEGWYECVAENQLGRSVGRTYLKVLEHGETAGVVTTVAATTASLRTTSSLPLTSTISVTAKPSTSEFTEKYVPSSTTQYANRTSPESRSGDITTQVGIPFDAFTVTSTSTPFTSTSTLSTTPEAITTKSTADGRSGIGSTKPIASTPPSSTGKKIDEMPEVITAEIIVSYGNASDESSDHFMNSFENRVAIFVAVGIVCLLATLLIAVLAIVVMRKRHRHRKYLLDKRNMILRNYSSNGSHPRRHRSNSGVMTTPLNSTLERPRNGFDILLAKEKGLS